MRTRLIGALVALLALSATACSYTTRVELPTTQPETSRILWDDGTTLASLHAEQNRDDIPFRAMGDYLPTAVVAIEDARYFEHRGVDPRGILRALTRDVRAGRAAEGGSTITQQYVRAVLLSPERDLRRKVKEAVLAVQLERQYSKRTILERYLNLVYFGNGAYGVQAAARTYFGVDAEALTLAQAAFLAGVIRSPGDYDPYQHPDAARARRDEVLQLRVGTELVDEVATVAPAPEDVADAVVFLCSARAKPDFVSAMRSCSSHATCPATKSTFPSLYPLLYPRGLGQPAGCTGPWLGPMPIRRSARRRRC